MASAEQTATSTTIQTRRSIGNLWKLLRKGELRLSEVSTEELKTLLAKAVAKMEVISDAIKALRKERVADVASSIQRRALNPINRHIAELREEVGARLLETEPCEAGEEFGKAASYWARIGKPKKAKDARGKAAYAFIRYAEKTLASRAEEGRSGFASACVHGFEPAAEQYLKFGDRRSARQVYERALAMLQEAQKTLQPESKELGVNLSRSNLIYQHEIREKLTPLLGRKEREINERARKEAARQIGTMLEKEARDMMAASPQRLLGGEFITAAIWYDAAGDQVQVYHMLQETAELKKTLRHFNLSEDDRKFVDRKMNEWGQRKAVASPTKLATSAARILGVDPNASFNEVHGAYIALAKQWHPDRNPSPDATEKFKDIAGAYVILANGAQAK